MSLFDKDLTLSRGESDFLQWVKKEEDSGELSIHPGVMVTRSDDKGFSLLATRNISVGEVIIKLSATLYEQFSAQTAEKYMGEMNPGFHHQVSQFAASITPQEQQQKNLIGSMCLAVQFLFSQTQSELETDHYREQRKAQGGFSPAYARMLFENTYPWNPNRVPHALSIPEDLLQWMAGTGLYRAFSSRRSLYNQLSQRVLGQEMHVTQLSSVMAIILSRAMSGQDGSGKAIPLGMVPVVDFANHADVPNARHSYSEDKALVLEAISDIEAGSEISITYGDTRDSASFLALYSFLPKPLKDQLSTPVHLLNPNDLLGLTVTVGNSSTKRRVNIPQAVIFAAAGLMDEAEGEAASKAQKCAEVVKIFEGVLLGYVPIASASASASASDATSAGRGDRVDALIHVLEEEERAREQAYQKERPDGSLMPLYMSKCRSEQERAFLAMCEEVVASELQAVKELLACCRRYRSCC